MAKLTCLSALFVLLMTAACWGQPDVLEFKVCDQIYQAAHPLSWENLKKEYERPLADGNFEHIYLDLILKLTTSENQQDGKIRERFQNKARLVLAGEVNPRPDFEIFKQVSADFTVKQFLFHGDDPFQIALPASLPECGQNATQLNELRYLANAFVKVDEISKLPAIDAVFQRIRDIEQQFDRYLFEGFPMFPWEAYLNSRFLAKKHIAEGPPRHQIIALHPGVAIETDTQSFSAAEPDLAMTIEPFGWIYYPKGGKYQSWWGLSTVASIKDDDGFGVGVLAHYKNFSLGVTWHDSDEGGSLFDDDPFILLSMDLYQFVGEKYRSYNSYKERVRELRDGSLRDALN